MNRAQLKNWPDQPITFTEAVDLVHVRLFEAFVGPHLPPQKLDPLLPAPTLKNRLLVTRARELLFQAFSEGKLTLWARTNRSVHKGGPIDLPVPPLPISMGQNGHFRTGYWKGMRLISLGYIPDSEEGRIVRDLAGARDKVLDKIAFVAWMDEVFPPVKAEFPILRPASDHQLILALQFLVDELNRNNWSYLSEAEVLELIRPAFDGMGRLAQVERIRTLFWSDVRPANWPIRKGRRKLPDRKSQIEHLAQQLQLKLLEVFSAK